MFSWYLTVTKGANGLPCNPGLYFEEEEEWDTTSSAFATKLLDEDLQKKSEAKSLEFLKEVEDCLFMDRTKPKQLPLVAAGEKKFLLTKEKSIADKKRERRTATAQKSKSGAGKGG